MRHPMEAEARPNEPASVLLHGLGLAITTAEWRQVLIAARSGDRSLKLLQDQALLTSRLRESDLSVRLQALDQLAAMNDPAAWEAVGPALNDPQLRKRAAERIAWAKYFPLFDAIWLADKRARFPDVEIDPIRYVPEPLDRLVKTLSLEDIRTLLAQDSPRIDLLCLSAMRHQQRFELLEDLVDLLNRRPSKAAVATVESLLIGPDPSWAGGNSDDSARDPWKKMETETHMGSLDQAALTATGKRSYRMQQRAVALGRTRRPENWSALRDLYLEWLKNGSDTWWASGFGKAMYESDPDRTLAFMRSQLNPSQRRASTAAALATLGLIADRGSLDEIEAFREQASGGDFDTNPHYRKYLDYALHRCRQVHGWRLVKDEDIYSIVQE